MIRVPRAGVLVGSLGHTSEDETGLVYIRARWMDPSLGRFISEDRVRDGHNWFVYAGNTPANKLDSNGKEDYWNWEFQMWRTEWRYVLHHAPEFRLVAAAFLAGWWSLFAAQALGGGAGDQINSMLSLNILTTDAASVAGRPPSPAPPGERVKAFYAGYSACLSLTVMFLFPDEFRASGPLDPTRWF